LYVFREAPFSDEARRVMQRFADVFHLAYTRYQDLQKAEARARDAERQASLDRVRAEIASMRTAEDLQRITPLVWRELTSLGVPFSRCGVFIIDETAEHVRAYLSTPGGDSLAVLHLPFDIEETTHDTVAHWRSGQVYRDRWDRERFLAWMNNLLEQGLIEASSGYRDDPPEQLALHFVPFEQGMLYVGSDAPLSGEQVDLVQALADAFAVAYARYEDFTRLEAAKAEVDAALAELKATQAQLIHSEKMASLGQMTAGIAHEIKNPLNFINNFAEVNEELADELRQALQTGEDLEAILADLKQNASLIAQHGRRADGIVRAMMQHASGGKGDRQQTQLNALVEEYVGLAFHGKRAQSTGFNCEVERDYDAAVGEVSIVPQEIGRVLLNLLSNAFDAVNERAGRINGSFTPTVSVQTRMVGGRVEVRVTDNGGGIPPSVRDRIFEPFYTTKPTGSGTGLGLSLSYDIVTQGHGGTLEVESTEGQGAIFIVTLPA
jgi:signal transduction histidine kinase